MTWPDATYKIIVEGGGGLLTFIFLLAMFTDFFENIFGRATVREVEVVPEDLNNALTEIVAEIRVAAREGKHNSTMLAEWATRITDALNEEEQ